MKNLVKTKVEVRSFNIDWLLNDRKNFLQFSVVLAKCKTQQIYQTDFMTVLVEEFWAENFDQIFKLCFMPWLFYMICTLYFFASVL